MDKIVFFPRKCAKYVYCCKCNCFLWLVSISDVTETINYDVFEILPDTRNERNQGNTVKWHTLSINVLQASHF